MEQGDALFVDMTSWSEIDSDDANIALEMIYFQRDNQCSERELINTMLKKAMRQRFFNVLSFLLVWPFLADHDVLFSLREWNDAFAKNDFVAMSRVRDTCSTRGGDVVFFDKITILRCKNHPGSNAILQGIINMQPLRAKIRPGLILSLMKDDPELSPWIDGEVRQELAEMLGEHRRSVFKGVFDTSQPEIKLSTFVMGMIMTTTIALGFL